MFAIFLLSAGAFAYDMGWFLLADALILRVRTRTLIKNILRDLKLPQNIIFDGQRLLDHGPSLGLLLAQLWRTIDGCVHFL